MTAKDPSATEQRNKALVETAFGAWRDGTGGPFTLLADAVEWTIVGHSDAAGTYASRDDFMTRVIGPFNARMTVGLKPTVRELHADGDDVVIFFDAEGVARDGQVYANTYAWFWTLTDGQVTRAYAFFDSLVFNDLWRRVQPVAQG
jgi:uncharacterized protein